MTGLTNAARRVSGRPERVSDLLYQGGIYPVWWAHNRQKNRFYILNVQEVMGQLNVPHTSMAQYFNDAPDQMKNETSWASQYPLSFGCHHNQIFPDKLLAPKIFDHAVTIIFVLEKYAKAKRQDLNVYDHLRIIPAQYFIDDLDKARYDSLAQHYRSLSDSDRRTIFDAGPNVSLDEAVATAVSQGVKNSIILKQMSWGHCVTRYVADHVRQYINGRFPVEFHLGPVLASGQEGNYAKGGSKNAVPQLKVKKMIRPEELPALPLDEEPQELDYDAVAKIKTTEPMPFSSKVNGIDWIKAPMHPTEANRDNASNGTIAFDGTGLRQSADANEISPSNSTPQGDQDQQIPQ